MTRTTILTDPLEAAQILRAGGIVAVPTETVFGLAARFDLPDAVSRVFAAKGRPADNPLIVHLGAIDWLPRVTTEVAPQTARLLARFAPGPLTVTVPRGPQVSPRISAGLPSVAVRIPADPRIHQVLMALDIPLVAPSANRSGRPSPTTWEAAYEELGGRIDAVLTGQASRIGIESTVVDCCAVPPVLLRPGAISLESLASILPDIEVLLPNGSPEVLASPGMRYRHYSPSARVILFTSPAEVVAEPTGFYLGLQPHPRPTAFAAHHVFANVEEYARWLFTLFRRADASGARHIYCQRVSLRGMGRGLMDRIERAAAR